MDRSLPSEVFFPASPRQQEVSSLDPEEQYLRETLQAIKVCVPAPNLKVCTFTR